MFWAIDMDQITDNPDQYFLTDALAKSINTCPAPDATLSAIWLCRERVQSNDSEHYPDEIYFKK